MSNHVDRDHLTITGAHATVKEPAHLAVGEDDVLIVVTKAFGPAGDSLVGISDVTFDGYPAVTLKVRTGNTEALVHLSPIHGDRRKVGLEDLAQGTRCELLCPVSGQPLDQLAAVEDGSGAHYCAVYLTERLSDGAMVMVSNVWGHYHSRIIDNFELISSFNKG